jgi:Fibronectin type III-like domain
MMNAERNSKAAGLTASRGRKRENFMGIIDGDLVGVLPSCPRLPGASRMYNYTLHVEASAHACMCSVSLSSNFRVAAVKLCLSVWRIKEPHHGSAPARSVRREPQDVVVASPGGSKKVILELDRRSFAYIKTATEQWDALPDTYNILIGSSSQDIRLKGQFKLPAQLNSNT